jgi:dTDP-4-dehydrorhamnose reductase
MKILVLGGNGMLGHRATALLSERHEVVATLRCPDSLAAAFAPRARLVAGVSAEAPASIVDVMSRVRPDAVVNCVGIVKQRLESRESLPSIRVNALLPHELARLCSVAGARFIHISTGCVFAGTKGCYTEDDTPDAPDLYGRTKLLGEVDNVPGAVTVRTSLVSWEIERRSGVLEWFATRRGSSCPGYTRAVFSGLASTDLVDVIERLCTTRSDIDGLWHVSTEPISKYDLLTAMQRELGWDIDIQPVAEPVIDRSLDSSRFRARTGWAPRPWHDAVARLASERVMYEGLD